MSTPRAFLVGLIGSGIGPSLTPSLHMTEAARHALSYVYRRIDLGDLGLQPDEIGEILTWAERLGYDALNVTHPCKQAVIPHLDELSPQAAGLGAVNTVLLRDGRRIGHNTDTSGFESAFRDEMGDEEPGAVALLGAGGAGSAVADALLRLGARRLDVIDVDHSRAERLAGELARRHSTPVRARSADGIADVLAEADGLAHCTPTGMREHPGLPVAADVLRPDLWVADIVYRPLETQLLRVARERGCRTVPGGGMAVHQAADAFELITGIRPDPARMRRDFTRLIEATGEAPSRPPQPATSW
ncbi:shikimate dehydrogenase [Microbacterium binotii]|uniref:shikimate dehydrogenase n=1 Tax=Microbacterium binotii TaxID=462710 RepID=UPI001F4612C7|nr:shikimate dehydrogenase [Microbacterium binotii]UIN29259.1 shikimate dehydrogenase [Microbacterium binotii]